MGEGPMEQLALFPPHVEADSPAPTCGNGTPWLDCLRHGPCPGCQQEAMNDAWTAAHPQWAVWLEGQWVIR